MTNGKRYMNAAICNKITQVAYDTYYKDIILCCSLIYYHYYMYLSMLDEL